MSDAEKRAGRAGREHEKAQDMAGQITSGWGVFRAALGNLRSQPGRAALASFGIVLGVAYLVSVCTSRVAIEGIQDARMGSGAGIERPAEFAGPGAEEARAEMAQRTARQNWQVLMELLVWAVCIPALILMLQTERYREIGLMKGRGLSGGQAACLVLTEGALLGLFASIVGIVVGHVPMLAVYMMKEDATLLAEIHWGRIALYMLAALVVGVLAMVIAAVPATVRAARLRPAEAAENAKA